MNLGKITIITPPDKIFNLNVSYMLVSPSMHVKQQFQAILSKSIDDLNVFIYEHEESDIDWLLSVLHMVDVVIIDVDNSSQLTKSFISFMLSHPNVFYITSDELTPFNLISKNRIYNLDWVAEELNNDINEGDEEDYDDQQED